MKIGGERVLSLRSLDKYRAVPVLLGIILLVYLVAGCLMGVVQEHEASASDVIADNSKLNK